MDAEDRVWEVVRRAYEEREPHPRTRHTRTALVAAVVVIAALAAAVATPPGHAVFEQVRRAVGVEHAASALFSLPAPGRLLVQSAEAGGTWVVDEDGARRPIGRWAYASWSPHGKYIVAATQNELVAIDPKGHVHWRLARRDVSSPVWEGTTIDTRIAYFAESGLRVVAGDGTDDRLLDAYVAQEPVAWDPAQLHTLAYETGGSVVLQNVDTRKILWRRPLSFYGKLEWSDEGARLAVVGANRIAVLNAQGRQVSFVSSLTGYVRDASFEPGTHRLAVVARLAGRSEVKLVDVDHPGSASLLFAGPGAFGDLAWSPNGAWLLVDWPTADQWLFIHDAHVRAVANVRAQFPRPDRLGPMFQLDGGWCCRVY